MIEHHNEQFITGAHKQTIILDAELEKEIPSFIYLEWENYRSTTSANPRPVLYVTHLPIRRVIAPYAGPLALPKIIMRTSPPSIPLHRRRMNPNLATPAGSHPTLRNPAPNFLSSPAKSYHEMDPEEKLEQQNHNKSERKKQKKTLKGL